MWCSKSTALSSLFSVRAGVGVGGGVHVCGGRVSHCHQTWRGLVAFAEQIAPRSATAAKDECPVINTIVAYRDSSRSRRLGSPIFLGVDRQSE